MFDFDATLPLMALQFVLLTLILNAVFYKPLTKVMDERGDYIRKSETDATERLAKAEHLARQYEQELAESRKQSQAIIAAAQAEAQKIVAQQISEAQQEAQTQRELTQRELDQQKQEAMSSLEQQVDALSQQIFDKLLGSQLV